MGKDIRSFAYPITIYNCYVFSGHIEQIYIHKKIQVFNVGVITPWDTSFTNDCLPFLVFINIHNYAN